MKQFRQGDLIIETVDVVPVDAVPVAPVAGRFVLADGEATGHAHTIAAELGELFERNGVLYFKTGDAPAPLTHQEHETHMFAPRTIQRVRRQIVEDAEHAPRQVLD